MDQIIFNIAVALPGFLIGIVLHEWAHAWMATKFGDDTALRQGRLTLNPMDHYDLMGTIVWPIICIAIGGVMFGWAKPVPVNPSRFSNVKRGIFWVSFAGPLANLFLAILSAFFIALVMTKVPMTSSYFVPLSMVFKSALVINLILALFNLIPFPPLDGSKIVSTFLNYEQNRKYEGLQRYTIVFILILWMTPILGYIFKPAYALSNYLVSIFHYILI